jgi:hypothetical protein
VPVPNRVTPTGEIVAIDQRGLFLGNRGRLHERPREIARPWQVRRWITCVLAYKGWVAPKWSPGRYTALFFWDEAVALAAGHRPCALCRRADYRAWGDAWAAVTGRRDGADAMDLRLHADRLAGRAQRRHRRAWADLPAGTFVALGSDEDGGGGSDTGGTPTVVLADRCLPWSPAGYGTPVDRPARGDAVVLTPAVTVDVLAAGYAPVIHPA